MTPDQVKNAVRAVLTEERLLASFADRLPPPNDAEAELVVLGALVSGEIDTACADELDPDDFFIPLHRWAFSRFLDGARTVGALQERADSEGMRGPNIQAELASLAMQPVILMPPMLRWVARVREAADRRRIFDVCKRVLLGLQAGGMSTGEARTELRKLAL